jgi:hypothetical protein
MNPCLGQQTGSGRWGASARAAAEQWGAEGGEVGRWEEGKVSSLNRGVISLEADAE